jgi:hypothetical protein
VKPILMLQRLRPQVPLPWARPRAEVLLIVLIGAVALSPVAGYNEQDSSRICLSRALLAGRLSDDTCFAYTVDSSRYSGHLYSSRAPGMSVLEIVPAEVTRLRDPTIWTHEPDLRLWAVHLLVSGIPFLLCVFLVGRVSEGLAPRYGGLVMVAFGLGTMLASLAVAGFSHDLVACLAFAAFVLAWRRSPLAAGLASGAALTAEYPTAAILLVLLGYTALQGRRAVVRFVAGAAPGVALLSAYDWAAFGAPWHTPLSYTTNFGAGEKLGLFGIQLPHLHAARLVFAGDRGLLVTSPVLVAAAAGLVLLWRRGLRAESLACGVIVVAYLVAECGYFLPYGGLSPGPRFFVPALPFLALGLGPAFARWRVATTVLTAASLVATTAVVLTWVSTESYRGTIWVELGRTVGGHMAVPVVQDVLAWRANSAVAVSVVAALATAAFAVAARPLVSTRIARVAVDGSVVGARKAGEQWTE